MSSTFDLNNIDVSKLKMNTQGFDAIPLSDDQEALIQNVAGFIDEVRTSKILTCDADCQKNEKERLLFNDYLQAKQNYESAPRILEDSKKNFYEFSKGNLWYHDKREKEEQIKANKLAKVILDKYQTNAKIVGILINKYRDQEIYNGHLDDLAIDYQKKFQHLQKQYKDDKSNANIENRKSYYENQKSDGMEYLNHTLKIVYYLIVAIFMVVMIILNKQYKNPKIWGLSAVLIVYPYVIPSISHFYTFMRGN